MYILSVYTYLFMQLETVCGFFLLYKIDLIITFQGCQIMYTKHIVIIIIINVVNKCVGFHVCVFFLAMRTLLTKAL